MFTYVWEYRVRPERVDDFCAHYGPDGSWVALFRRSPGYVGTRLLRDVNDSGRFLTIDNWESREDYATFRRRFESEFTELDERCEALTASEKHLGDYEAAT